MVQNNLIAVALFSLNLLQLSKIWVGYFPFAARVIHEVALKILVGINAHNEDKMRLGFIGGVVMLHLNRHLKMPRL